MGKTRGALDFYREIVRQSPDSAQARFASKRIKAMGGVQNAQKGP